MTVKKTITPTSPRTVREEIKSFPLSTPFETVSETDPATEEPAAPTIAPCPNGLFKNFHDFEATFNKTRPESCIICHILLSERPDGKADCAHVEAAGAYNSGMFRRIEGIGVSAREHNSRRHCSEEITGRSRDCNFPTAHLPPFLVAVFAAGFLAVFLAVFLAEFLISDLVILPSA